MDLASTFTTSSSLVFFADDNTVSVAVLVHDQCLASTFTAFPSSLKTEVFSLGTETFTCRVLAYA